MEVANLSFEGLLSSYNLLTRIVSENIQLRDMVNKMQLELEELKSLEEPKTVINTDAGEVVYERTDE